MKIDLYLHDGLTHEDKILNLLEKIMSALDDLTAQVAATDGEVQSAITLLNGLYAALIAAGTDPTKLAALAADLKTNTDALAAAVAADQIPK